MKKPYTVLLNRLTYDKVQAYLEALQAGRCAGRFVQEQLRPKDISHITVEAFLEVLMRTKLPVIFAESVVAGDGSDWTPEELSILGDIGVATPVTVYDNGKHQHPMVHPSPFSATLLFIPGALLQSGGRQLPADWNEVVETKTLNSKAYQALYHRRLYPLFMYANNTVKQRGTYAFITIPGLGCGQFAGRFRGRLGEELKQALMTFLQQYGHEFSHIRGVYYDPYRECQNEHSTFHHITFLVRPLLQGNTEKPQLCPPHQYAEHDEQFEDCDLFSVVAWDHVSWPGNDFYGGARATDDGVKAAATNSMTVMTGVKGRYDARKCLYRQPAEYRSWEEVVIKNHIQLDVQGNLCVYSMPNDKESA
jgi:hypothetical protein